MPLLFAGVLIVLRQKVPVTDYPNATVYQSFSVSSLPTGMPHFYQLAFVPSNSNVVRQVVEDVRGQLELSAGGFQPNIHHRYEYILISAVLSTRPLNRHILVRPGTNIWEGHTVIVSVVKCGVLLISELQYFRLTCHNTVNKQVSWQHSEHVKQ